MFLILLNFVSVHMLDFQMMLSFGMNLHISKRFIIPHFVLFPYFLIYRIIAIRFFIRNKNKKIIRSNMNLNFLSYLFYTSVWIFLSFFIGLSVFLSTLTWIYKTQFHFFNTSDQSTWYGVSLYLVVFFNFT